MAGEEERPSGGRDDEKGNYPVGEEGPSGGGDVKEGNYPLGFRFKPTPQELVEFYLLPKLLDKPTVSNDTVIEADAYECDPEILTKRYEEKGADADDNWYFLSPRSRRYPGGDRPTRRTADNRGRWKPSTGQSKPGKNAAAGGHSKAKKKNLSVGVTAKKKNLSIGAIEFTENTLAYYVGDPKKETKTKWLMHELTVPEPEKEKDLDGASGEKPRDHMLLNKYVMCRIYKSPLKKWKEVEDGECSTSSAPACDDEDVPTSSQSGPAPESGGETSASVRTLSSKQAGKRPVVEQPSGHANAPNKRARASSQQTMPPGPPGPTTHANGGGGMRVPVGAGAAAGYYHGVPGLPPLIRPPAVYNTMQGPVQLQRPPLTYGHNVQARPPVQGPPVLRLYPPHRAAATATDSLGRSMMMRPPNPAAGQPPARPPSVPRPPRQPPSPQQQQQQMESIMTAYVHRVFAQLAAEVRLQNAQKKSASSCAGQQQQISPTASTQPACSEEGADHPAGAEAMAPPLQSPAPQDFYPCSGAQQQQQQQSSSAIPAASVPPDAVAPVEATTPVADDALKVSVPGDANEGSAKENCYDHNNEKLFADLAAYEGLKVDPGWDSESIQLRESGR